jgi:hypothetical protein
MSAQTLTLVHDGSFQVDSEPSHPAPVIPTALICDNALFVNRHRSFDPS